jgi:predicted O-methyltransferase YrrM
VLVRLQRRHLGEHAQAVERASRLGAWEDAERGEEAIDELRGRLAADERKVEIEDHGAGTRGLTGANHKPSHRTVSEIYGRAAATPAWGRFLFALVRELKPRTILELGTNLGVSAAHLSAGLAVNEERHGVTGQLTTIEGDATLADLARVHLAELGHSGRTEVVTGRFAELLETVKSERGPFDLVFIDGHHEEAATIRYWQSLRSALAEGACVAFDDIEPGRPVRRAWRRIIAEARERDAGFVDLVGMGLLFTSGA